MPNWCNCDLIVSGPPEVISRFREQSRGDGSGRAYALSAMEIRLYGSGEKTREPNGSDAVEELVFERLYPIPPEILAQPYDPTGYAWEREHWGTKWGGCHVSLDIEDREGGQLTYTLDTAWSPPLPFLDYVSRQWPALTFTLHYEEGGMGFLGDALWAGGERVEDCRRTLAYDDPAAREELIELGWIDAEDEAEA